MATSASTSTSELLAWVIVGSGSVSPGCTGAPVSIVFARSIVQAADPVDSGELGVEGSTPGLEVLTKSSANLQEHSALACLEFARSSGPSSRSTVVDTQPPRGTDRRN